MRTPVYMIMLFQISWGEKPKIMRFQVNNKYVAASVEEWAIYKEEIPAFESFTACHWELLRFFNNRDTCPWSLCYKMKDIDNDFECVQFWYNREPDSGGRYVVASAGFGGGLYGGKSDIGKTFNLNHNLRCPV